MRVEVLFPEFGNFFGDVGNILYLRKSVPEAEIINTDNRSVPRFVTEDVDMIYIGSMSERKQLIAVERLSPYKDRIRELIEKGVVFLVTGNAMELFGEYILDKGEKIPMLGMFPFYADRYIQEIRHNSRFIGSYKDIKIVGYKSQFSNCIGSFDNYFLDVIGGYGNNNTTEDKKEGINYKNFFATYLLGPLLPLNPLFTKHLLSLMGYNGDVAFEEEAIDAYNLRVEGLDSENAIFWMDEHG